MKKIMIFLVGLLLILSVKKINASEIEITYSNWSVFYPSGLDERFIESEARYKWYKFENNNVVYSNEYAASLDGYIKDEGSETIFYRYIKNEVLLLDANNNKVTDTEYCKKNFCFALKFVEPEMVNTISKIEKKYDSVEIPSYTPEVSPFTGDTAIHYIVLFSLSIIVLSFVIIKRRKMSNE